MTTDSREFLVEMTVYLDSAGTVGTLLYSANGFNSEAGDLHPSQHYEARLSQPGTFEQALFKRGTTTGASLTGYGVVVLSNTDGGLDGLIDYGFAGGRVRILYGLPGSTYSAFTVVMVGTMEQPTFEWDRVLIRIKDRQSELERVALQSVVYDGSGLEEGSADDIKGFRKPLLYGRVYNVPAVLVRESNRTYQVNDGAIASLDYVYDRSVDTGITIDADAGSISSLRAATVDASHVTPWLGGGLFRMGSVASGVITADVTQGASAANRTVAQILKAMALQAGIDAGDIEEADVTALDAANSAVVGHYIDDDRSAQEAMDDVATSIGAWYGFDQNGKLRMGRFEAPSGTALVELDDTNVLSIRREATNDKDRGIPSWKVNVGFAKNFTPDGDVAAGATAPRKAWAQKEYRSGYVTDSSVLLKYPLAAELVFNTLLTNGTDAGTEANRLLDLYKTRRDHLTIRVWLSTAVAAALTLGSVVNLTLPRYGMAGGKLFVVIGIVSRFDVNLVDLRLWG